MKYEVAYISRSGNTEKLAHGIADCLPSEDTFVTDLATEEITDKADVYLIGFGLRNNTIPLKIMDVLEKLEGKIIIFFATAPVIPTEEHTKEVERRLEPFMPDECDYRGLFLCPGQVSEESFNKIRTVLEQNPGNEQAEMVYNIYNSINGHPDENDIADACKFVRKKLEIIQA